MESIQKELLNVLLGHVLSLGLISKTTYLSATELVYSALDLPDFFRYSAHQAEGDNR